MLSKRAQAQSQLFPYVFSLLQFYYLVSAQSEIYQVNLSSTDWIDNYGQNLDDNRLKKAQPEVKMYSVVVLLQPKRNNSTIKRHLIMDNVFDLTTLI